MKHFLRPYQGVAVLLGAGMAIALPGAWAQALRVAQFVEEPSTLMLHASSSQGYLGVDLADVDQEKAQALKLKEVRGAVITLIDHDAPAGQKGLKVNDVVLEVNGQAVEGAEQLRRMLREIPARRKVTLKYSRDGNVQTLELELADRRAMEHDVWNKIGTGSDVFAESQGKGLFSGGGDPAVGGGFFMPFFGPTLNVGAMVEPLTSQMAEYLGVPSGLMVKQVAHKSEAAAAGLKAFDVILKVGTDAVTTLADWDRALRTNQGKPVQVTILRDKKQQTLTLQVDSRHKGALEIEEMFPSGDCPLVAEIGPEFAEGLGRDADVAAQAMREQAEGLKEQLKAGQLGASRQQAEELRKQAEKLRESIKAEEFKIDPKQMDELKRQMEEFRKSFRPEDFKIDQKQMDELKQQMEDLKTLGFGGRV